MKGDEVEGWGRQAERGRGEGRGRHTLEVAKRCKGKGARAVNRRSGKEGKRRGGRGGGLTAGEILSR